MAAGSPYKDFDFFVDTVRLKVKFVTGRTLGRTGSYQIGGDYTPGSKVIRLLRYEAKGALRATLLHELCHYLWERNEMTVKTVNEEDICDLMSWLPMVFEDSRNTELLDFLGLQVKKERKTRKPQARRR